MKAIIYTLIFSLAIQFVMANDYAPALSKAADLYNKGDYEKAAKEYESILAGGNEAAELYYNLGNCYYKLKTYPRAILNFERAKILAPGDDDINYNIQVCQKFVVDKIDVLPQIFISSWIDSFTSSMSSNAWAWFSVVFFVVALGLAFLFLFSSSSLLKKIFFALAVISLLVSVVAFLSSWSQKKNVENNKNAIVFTPTVNAKSSPDENGTTLFVVHEGLKVAVQDYSGDWIRIKLVDGNVGWVKKTDVEII